MSTKVSSVSAALEAQLRAQIANKDPKEIESVPDLSVVAQAVDTKGKTEYKDIIGQAHPDGEFWFTVYKDSDWHKDVRGLIPDVNPNFTEFDHEYALAVLMSIEFDKPMLAYGPPGTGKSTTPEQVCARIRYPYMFIQGMGGTEPSDYVGSPWVKDGSMEWKHGPLSWAVEKGVFLLYDEPFKASAQTNMCIQSLLDDRRTLKLYGHPDPIKGHMKAHPKFRMTLADNVRGVGDGMDKYAAEIQDQSTVNRCKIKVKVGYPTEATEIKIISAQYPSLPPALVTKMVKVANLLRAGWNKGSVSMPFTLRDTNEWADQTAMYGSHKTAFRLSYFNGIDGDSDEGASEIKAIKDMFRVVALEI